MAVAGQNRTVCRLSALLLVLGKTPRKNSFQIGRKFLSTCLDLESVIIYIITIKQISGRFCQVLLSY